MFRLQKKTLLLFIMMGFLFPGPVHADQDRNLFLEKTALLQEKEPVSAEAALTRGTGKELRFLYGIAEAFDDNIYLTRRGRNSDWITRFFPAIEGTFQNAQNFFRLKTEAPVTLYAKNGHQSNWSPGATLDMEFFRNSKFKASLHDTVRHMTDISGASTQKPIQRIDNEFLTRGQYDLSKKSIFRLDYNLNSEKYFTSTYKQFSSLENVVMPSFLWNFSPKITFLAEYSLGIYDYVGGANLNSLFNRVQLGAQTGLTEKSKLDLKGGYEVKDYHSRDYKDAHVFVFSGNYYYLWTPKTTFRVFGFRDIMESRSTNSPYFKATSVGLGAAHFLTPKITTGLSGYWGLNHYPTRSQDSGGDFKKEKDTFLNVTATTEYRLPYGFLLFLTYSFTKELSNMDDLGYTDNKVSLGLKGAF